LKRSPELEGRLWELLEVSAEESTKSAYFRTFRSVALTDDGRSRLMKVWSREEEIRGLRFSETDFMTLALELAVREVPQWQGVLDEQESRIENEERRSRFRFVRQAVSADPLIRDRFFHSLVRLENRSKEQWVVEALRYLHHPLRARESEKYLLPGLQMLREIKRTGDIFFPKAWLDASLDGHQSEEAAQVVRTFLQVSDDPPRLLGKVRQSADGLFRAARMVDTSR
jgi:aminopeptidase N